MLHIIFYSLILLSFNSNVFGYNATQCCQLALEHNAFYPPLSPGTVPICGQSYADDQPAAPSLMVRYSYCSANCSGIGPPKYTQPSQWLMPIVQFILPAVIFSMIVPRRKNLDAGELLNVQVLPENPPGQSLWFPLPWMIRSLLWLWSMLVWLFFSFIVLAVIVVDNTLWIGIIVATAGQMLVEGLYESQLDFKILKAIDQVPSWIHRAELLTAIVSGNVRQHENSLRDPQQLIKEALPKAGGSLEPTRQTSQRLLSVMSSQASFGAAVGIPVAFYLGAFAYSILDLLNDKSDQDSAIALAFGVEWMIIVHVSIVSGCLLASNNPAAAVAIVGYMATETWGIRRVLTTDPIFGPGRTAQPGQGFELTSIVNTGRQNPRAPQQNHPQGHSSQESSLRRLVSRLKDSLWKEAYETVFEPVSMTSRGSNKRRWIKNTSAYQKADVRDKLQITWVRWWLAIFLPTVVLVVLPPVSGGIVAWITPPTGPGCRSLSFIVYAGLQAVLTIISACETAASDEENKNIALTIYRLSQKHRWRFLPVKVLLYLAPSAYSLVKFFNAGDKTWAIFVLFGVSLMTLLPARLVVFPLSLFTVIGGTIMQITGVYTNCFCYVNSQYWFHLDQSPGVEVASDTEDQRISSESWAIMGTVATLFMIATSYAAWWYQRWMRHKFREAARALI